MHNNEFLVGNDKLQFRWIDDWVRIPNSESSIKNGRTHGVAVTGEGNIIIFHQSQPAVLIYNSQGQLLNSWGNDWSGAHGLCLVKENGEEFLWLTDEFSGKVEKRNLDGEMLMELAQPEISIYEQNKYSPTWIAVYEERFGGNGDIWVSDGYGASIINRYDKYGNYINSIDGTEGEAGKFNCPHGIWIDNRKSEPELYIADRGNKRVQVYDLDGKYKRKFGEGILTCPCAFAAFEDNLFIPELSAKLAVLNKNDEVIAFLGENESICSIPGWPDLNSEFIIKGKFNSPHSAAIDRQGNIYVVEWIKGGRVIKLERV